ncbi:Uma2 family endonuclease [Benzoatithermus flavus]|uniref:Uma2 family endonuclease n=1 Tax=Benzoatithermus flavus TaxID=3108223 RepID=A0ABU8XLR2_9PROT
MKAMRGTRRWTVADYHRMAEAGILDEDDRVELLDGEIFDMSPIGSVHAARVGRIADRPAQRCGDRALVRRQNPILLDDHSEPEPDIAVVLPRSDYYLLEHPKPADVLLLIEIADSSARSDRAKKLPLYAAAGIPEVWLVDLSGDRVEICRDPAEGRYATVRDLGRGTEVAPLALPDVRLEIVDLLPPPGMRP